MCMVTKLNDSIIRNKNIAKNCKNREVLGIVGIEIALFSLILHLIYIVRQTFGRLYEKRVCHLFYIFTMNNIYQL